MFPRLLKAWIWISASASAAGWLLSSFGQLNITGYLAFVLLVGAALWICRKRSPASESGSGAFRKCVRRFRRPLPLCFATLALLIFLSGILYAPANHTGLSYRLARVLHWLAHERWHWIHTPNFRMNDRACGMEWLTAPVLLFTRSDRSLFLLNFIPFLLLPGLIFSVWTRLGVRLRVAWHWMWIFPTAYSFLLQAGSIGNDTFPTVYALAAVDFALRAFSPRIGSRKSFLESVFCESKNPGGSGFEISFANLCHSLIAASLLTGAKASNLPLLLPWAAVIFAGFVAAGGEHNATVLTKNVFCLRSVVASFCRRLLHFVKSHPIAIVGVFLLAGLVSFVPTAVLNVLYCGDWSGLNLERTGMNMKNPFVGIWGNLLILLFNNFLFPFVPFAKWWNAHGLSLLPHAIVAPLTANFEDGYHLVGELPTEDWTGLGFGVSVLAAISFFAGLFFSRRKRAHRLPVRGAQNFLTRAIMIAPWIALLAYCMKTGMVSGARLISPYYPLLLPLLLASPSQSQIVRLRWWRSLAWLNFALAFPVLIMTPYRPLWPAQTILSQLSASHPSNALLSRARNVYLVYAVRSDPLADVRALLPLGTSAVGFLGTEDDIEVSLWRPYMKRRVEDYFLDDPATLVRTNGIEHLVLGGFNLSAHHLTLDDYLSRTGARLLATTNATIKLGEGSQAWYVLYLPHPP